jgi:hypothetical protein
MPYYSAGDYYQGDNYAAGGIFSGLARLAGKALTTFTPVGRIASRVVPIARKLLGAGSRIAARHPIATSIAGSAAVDLATRALIRGRGGAEELMLPEGLEGLEKVGRRGRRSMDYGNIKALRRANRRAHGFLKLYRKAVSYYMPKTPKGKAYVHFKKRAK